MDHRFFSEEVCHGPKGLALMQYRFCIGRFLYCERSSGDSSVVGLCDLGRYPCRTSLHLPFICRLHRKLYCRTTLSMLASDFMTHKINFEAEEGMHDCLLPFHTFYWLPKLRLKHLTGLMCLHSWWRMAGLKQSVAPFHGKFDRRD